MMNKNVLKILTFLFLLVIVLTSCNSNQQKSSESVFTILSSSENKDVENLLSDFGRENNIKLEFVYAGTIDIMELININASKYDAVWPANSIWLYMLNNPSIIKNSKSTSINPVVFAISKNKAVELGFVEKNTDVYVKDIIKAVKEKKLNFLMPSATQTNSGASAYLGFYASLAGNPQVLTSTDIENNEIQSQLLDLFKGVSRSSGSDEVLEEMFLNGKYDALVNYEASIIRLNKTLQNEKREPLYLIYPVDGVSLSDSPFAYVDNGDSGKKEIFQKIQNYLVSEKVQKELAKSGRRTGYGGLIPYGDNETFNPEWGIDSKKYLSPIKYPSSDVIKEALNLYQTSIKKPSVTVFCLDFSGSMSGEGKKELVNSMNYILDNVKASESLIQFSEQDKIYVVPFDNKLFEIKMTENGNETKSLLDYINNLDTRGGTNIYSPVLEGLSILEKYSADEYSKAIVLMTDGKSNVHKFNDLSFRYNNLKSDVPVFSITFGSADPRELEEIAELTNATVFDGKENLLFAFKKVRGYN